MTQNVKEKMRTNNGNNTKGDMSSENITIITNPNKKWKLKGENTWFARGNDNIGHKSITNKVTPLFMKQRNIDNCTLSNISHDKLQTLKIITKLHQNQI